MKITEGSMPFYGFQTRYRIVGEDSAGKAPLLLLHGGPGSTRNYFEVLDGLADDGRRVISYDQLGCGESYLDGHPELWKKETWEEELMAIREHLGLDEVHLLGQSWGAMLIISYLVDRKPSGVRSAVLSSGHSSSSLWAREQHRLIRYLPEKDRAAIAKAEETGSYEDPAYLEANRRYMEWYCAGPYTEDSPECLRREKKTGKEAYLYGWGPNEYVPTGSLKDFEYTDRLPEIGVPVLIVSGTDDICTPLVAKTMADAIPGARWELMAGARHTCFADCNEEYMKLARAWLSEHD